MKILCGTSFRQLQRLFPFFRRSQYNTEGGKGSVFCGQQPLLLTRQPPVSLDLAACPIDGFLQIEHLQARQNLALQSGLLLLQATPLDKVVDLESHFLNFVIERFQVIAHLLQFTFDFALLPLGFEIGIQYLLIAEYLKNQVQQSLRRIFAKLVGITLFQR